MEKGWDFHLKKIEHFCESEGIPKWKIRQHTAMGRKQSTITTMASLALNGFLKGMIMSPSDKVLLEQTLSQSSQETTSLGIITETDIACDDLTDVSHMTVASDSDLYGATSDESNMEDDDTLENVTTENRHIIDNQHVNAEEEHAHAHPDHGIMKNASRGTLKSVTFQPKENKPLIHKHDSVDSRDIPYEDDDESFTGWK